MLKFKMIHIPDMWHKAADAVFHDPTSPTNPDMIIVTDDVEAWSDSAIPPLLDPFRHSFIPAIGHKEPASIISFLLTEHSGIHMR